MTFMNMEKIGVASKLKAAHFELPRAEALKAAFGKCVEEYYLSRQIEDLEVRGLVVTGHSRVGKSLELKKLRREFNESGTLMPDGRPAKIVSCVLSGRVTFKDLGIKTLLALGYDLQRNRTQEYIWERVLGQAQEQGVIGIHYDECQHVFGDNAKSNKVFLDSFKTMMKEPRWPMMMILSGVHTLTGYIQSYEQLYELVDHVHFKTIKFGRDKNLLNRLLFAFADEAKIEVEHLVTPDFLARLDQECFSRWGLVIELLIDTLVTARMGAKPI
jgi:hypothetical protein